MDICNLELGHARIYIRLLSFHHITSELLELNSTCKVGRYFNFECEKKDKRVSIQQPPCIFQNICSQQKYVLNLASTWRCQMSTVLHESRRMGESGIVLFRLLCHRTLTDLRFKI